MKLTLENRSKNWIRGYDNGEIRVADQHIHHHCLISAEAITPWNAADDLTDDAIRPILAMNPEVVLLGLANINSLPPASIYAAFLKRNIGFEVMEVGAACRTFNVLLGEGRHVVLALLLEKVEPTGHF